MAERTVQAAIDQINQILGHQIQPLPFAYMHIFLSGGNYLKNTAMLFIKMKDYASFQLKWLPNSAEFW